MTEADIPLRDQIARVLADPNDCSDGACEIEYEQADALLAAFDISPRGSLPVNEEPE